MTALSANVTCQPGKTEKQAAGTARKVADEGVQRGGPRLSTQTGEWPKWRRTRGILRIIAAVPKGDAVNKLRGRSSSPEGLAPRRGQSGRPPVSKETRALIRRRNRENPLWDAPPRPLPSRTHTAQVVDGVPRPALRAARRARGSHTAHHRALAGQRSGPYCDWYGPNTFETRWLSEESSTITTR